MKKYLFLSLLIAALFPFTSQAQQSPKSVIVDSLQVCDSIKWINNEVFYSDTNVFYPHGDSVNVLVLKVKHSTNVTLDPVTRGCEYRWNGEVYRTSGTYVDTIANSEGCDSIMTLSLTISDTQRDTLDAVAACVSYQWNGRTLTESGFFSDTTTVESLACDSIVVLPLTISSTIVLPADSVTVCGQYTWHDSTYVEAGVHTLTLSDTTIACDTLYKLVLTLDTIRDTLQDYSVCDTYNWIIGTDTLTVTDSGFYSLMHNDDNHCTTIRYRQINVVPLRSVETTIDTTRCGNFSYRFEGDGLNAAYAIRSDSTIQKLIKKRTVALCVDSLSIVHCYVKPISYRSENVDACDSYEWNETVYTASTQDSLKLFRGAANGCDSIVRFNIRIFPSPVITSIEGRLQMEEPGSTRIYAVCDQSNVEYSWDVRSASGSDSYDGDTLELDYVATTTDIELTVTNTQSGCFTAQWLVVVVGVGIDDVEATQIRLYPNPTARMLMIESESAVREAIVYNTVGQQMIRTELNGGNSIEVGSLAKGTYTLQMLMQDGRTVNRKFVVIR